MCEKMESEGNIGIFEKIRVISCVKSGKVRVREGIIR